MDTVQTFLTEAHYYVKFYNLQKDYPPMEMQRMEVNNLRLDDNIALFIRGMVCSDVLASAHQQKLEDASKMQSEWKIGQQEKKKWVSMQIPFL